MELKQARNSYYHIIHKVKRYYWQNFLQKKEEKQMPNSQKLNQIDNGHFESIPNLSNLRLFQL